MAKNYLVFLMPPNSTFVGVFGKCRCAIFVSKARKTSQTRRLKACTIWHEFLDVLSFDDYGSDVQTRGSRSVWSAIPLNIPLIDFCLVLTRGQQPDAFLKNCSVGIDFH
jgi:hypothetical protein